MNLLLIFPPTGKVFREECCIGSSPDSFVPGQILVTLGILKKEGYLVDFIDGSVSSVDFDSFKKYDLVFVWVSLLDTFYEDIDFVKKIKLKGYNTGVVMPDTPLPIQEEVMSKYDFIDYLILGEEKELVILNLCNTLANDLDVNLLKGLLIRTTDSVLNNGLLPHTLEKGYMNVVAPVSELDLKMYNGAFVIWGNGCPYSCTYCLYRNTPIYYRSTDIIIQELKSFSGLPNFKIYLFALAMFDKNLAEDLCNKIVQEKLNIQFYLDLRAEQCELDILFLLKKAGCFKIIIGVEHSDESIRNELIKKNVTDSQIYQAVSNCHKASIIPQLEFIIGYPFDKKEHILKISEIVRNSLPCSYAIAFLKPWIGTPIYDLCKEYDLIKEDYTLSDYTNNLNLRNKMPTKYLSTSDIKKIYYQLYMKLLFINLRATLPKIYKYRKRLKEMIISG